MNSDGGTCVNTDGTRNAKPVHVFPTQPATMSLKTQLQKTHLNYVVSRACTPGHLALRHHVQAQPRPLAAMLLVIASTFTSIYDHGITTVRSNKLQRGSRVCVHRSAGILAGLRGKCLRAPVSRNLGRPSPWEPPRPETAWAG